MRRQTWNIMTLNVLVQKRKILVVMGFRGRIIKEVLMVRPAWSKWMALGNSLWREAFMCVCVWLIFMKNFMNVCELMSSWFPLLHSHQQYVEYVCEKLLFSSVTTFKVGTDTEPFFINYFFLVGWGCESQVSTFTRNSITVWNSLEIIPRADIGPQWWSDGKYTCSFFFISSKHKCSLCTELFQRMADAMYGNCEMWHLHILLSLWSGFALLNINNH